MVDVNEILAWVVTGGGAGIAAYWLMDQIPFLANLTAMIKRFVAWGVSVLLGWAAYFLAAWLGVWMGPTGAQPTTAQEWFVALVWVGGTVLVASQGFHAVRDLSKK